MRAKQHFLTILFSIIFLIPSLEAQIDPRYGNMGRRRITPQTQQAPEKAEPMTAEEMVEAEMPKIQEAIELSDFEEAVLRSILTKYVQQRIEVQILNLGPDKTREAFEDINIKQDEELKASLPEDKYLALKEYRENGGKKPKEKKKKKKKNKS
ncbi:hypothetical protein SAMN06265375_104136 [Muriicola jejuensis]|uniref:DUF4890 domain-containing protein n=1 Tax=Muriicola jejuensis TaxID=504488 RepID=A0A6P0UH68_9FLAO|nr:hypothetical protein [Muriicola jejuensis]NER11148.1 hypothetical protein [Muriicola jejuensis]SMP24079.1 hypothetical protein SAMN06265375_104136 [Muriicola jejuensis]